VAIALLGSVVSIAATDDDVYRNVVAELRAGGQYYDVFGHYLRAGHYATIPFVNWRPPLVYEFIRVAGDGVARWSFLLMGAVALALLASAERTRDPLMTVLLYLNALVIELAPRTMYFTEAWAGAAIALSAAAYQAQRRTVGAIAAGIALMMRELAAPYAVLCAWQAWRTDDRRERLLWVVIGGLSAGYYGVHVGRAIMAQQPGDLRSASWVAFGGVNLILRMTALATVTGQGRGSMVASAVWLAAALFSTLAPAMRFEMRMAVLLYVMTFAIVGQAHDAYWGLLFVPVQALAIGFVPDAARGLRRGGRSATRPQGAVRARVPTLLSS
jgi:hypothetical protein